MQTLMRIIHTSGTVYIANYSIILSLAILYTVFKSFLCMFAGIMVIETNVVGSTAYIDWKVTPSGDLSPRQRRQSSQTVEPLALSINCSFPVVNQVRSYFWWSPIERESLALESLPLGATGTCSARLYTHEGQGQVYTFEISTDPAPVGECLAIAQVIGETDLCTCKHCLHRRGRLFPIVDHLYKLLLSLRLRELAFTACSTCVWDKCYYQVGAASRHHSQTHQGCCVGCS